MTENKKKAKKRKEKKEHALNVIIDRGNTGGTQNFLMALLIDSMDRSSKIIKILTWVLVLLGIVGLIMAGFSLYMQYFSN